MSLQDLRNFFDPEAPEINGIPTIVEGIVVNNTMEDSSPFNSDGLRGLASALSESKDLGKWYYFVLFIFNICFFFI